MPSPLGRMIGAVLQFGSLERRAQVFEAGGMPAGAPADCISESLTTVALRTRSVRADRLTASGETMSEESG